MTKKCSAKLLLQNFSFIHCEKALLTFLYYTAGIKTLLLWIDSITEWNHQHNSEKLFSVLKVHLLTSYWKKLLGRSFSCCINKWKKCDPFTTLKASVAFTNMNSPCLFLLLPIFNKVFMISWQIHSQCDSNWGIKCPLFSQCVIVQRGALSRQEAGLRLQQVTDGPHALW